MVIHVTLVTCTPYAMNTHRLLVRGHRIKKPVKAAKQTPVVHSRMTNLWFWLLWIVIPILIYLLVLNAILKRKKKRREQQDEEQNN